MAKLEWDATGAKLYETGLDRGVLYIPNAMGVFTDGVPWNGLISVSENPSGADANPQYADNIKYLNLVSAEEFGATIEAFTYPDAFAQCDGSVFVPDTDGLILTQQPRQVFGLSYRTLLGNDLDGTDHGYKLHLIYNALAAPSEKSFNTINETPEAITFSWEITTTPVQPPSGAVWKPTAYIVIDSTKVNAGKLTAFENTLYGASAAAKLPTPAEVIVAFT